MSSPTRKKSKVTGTSEPPLLTNFIDNAYVASSSTRTLPVTTPHTGACIANVPLSTAADVETAIASSQKAFTAWSALTVKSRSTYLLRWWALIEARKAELAELIVEEHGKTLGEAYGSIAKGNETLEYAIYAPEIAAGKYLEVSRGVSCRDVRKPLGVVATIVPFNFPIMVPMWTLPISLVMGNTVVLKPSEKVPRTLHFLMSLVRDAQFPPGVVNLINGDAEAVNALISHEAVKAVSFVGTSRVADLVSQKCHALRKRCIALGGAKNHLVAAPDCHVEMTAQDVVNSFAGCAGQRCMAASVLLTIGQQPTLLAAIVEKASAISATYQTTTPPCMGPVIDATSLRNIHDYIETSVSEGAELLLDGRLWGEGREGYWVGPTILLHKNKEDKAMHDEIFGPVLSIYAVATKEEAIEMENACPYGNAACIYTTSGHCAQYFEARFSAGMIGCNIGVPVPREPFSFGGSKASKFGSHTDITGDGAIEFFSWRQKITTKWAPPKEQDWMS